MAPQPKVTLALPAPAVEAAPIALLDAIALQPVAPAPEKPSAFEQELLARIELLEAQISQLMAAQSRMNAPREGLVEMYPRAPWIGENVMFQPVRSISFDPRALALDGRTYAPDALPPLESRRYVRICRCGNSRCEKGPFVVCEVRG